MNYLPLNIKENEKIRTRCVLCISFHFSFFLFCITFSNLKQFACFEVNYFECWKYNHLVCACECSSMCYFFFFVFVFDVVSVLFDDENAFIEMDDDGDDDVVFNFRERHTKKKV